MRFVLFATPTAPCVVHEIRERCRAEQPSFLIVAREVPQRHTRPWQLIYASFLPRIVVGHPSREGFWAAAPHERFRLKQFADLGLAEPILRAVKAEGYIHPTPIQAEAIPAMLAERDIIGIAQTGTGKTAAFVLPLLHRIDRARQQPEPKACRALILVPTRELAAQITASIGTYGRFTRPSAAVIIGGARPEPQIRALRPGVDILIATPGRLEDHMRGGAVRLDHTTTVVLDEADQMLDLGFMPAIRRILGKLAANRQTVLFSATMPTQIRNLARDFLTDPIEIAVAPVARPVDQVDQRVMHVASAAKRQALVGLLSRPEIERAIVFTRTKHGADKVSQHLEKTGFSVAAIHGNKSQGQRTRALGAFRAGHVTILVATDVAARGIDINDVSHVINFELPNVPEAYVHRIGRTARAGKSGIAVSFCDPSERGLLQDIERLIGRRLAVGGEVGGGAPAPNMPRISAEPVAQKPGRTHGRIGQPNRSGKASAKPARKHSSELGKGAQTSGLKRLREGPAKRVRRRKGGAHARSAAAGSA